MYTSRPVTATSELNEAMAAERCLSMSDKPGVSVTPVGGEMGTRADVRREKYNWRSWGSCDLADGFSAALPVAGIGRREAAQTVYQLKSSVRGIRSC